MPDRFGPDLLRVISTSSGKGVDHRVIAIVFAAYIEDYITGALKRKMPGLNSALSNRMFRPGEGAIGSLSRKLDMARALEVLTPALCKDAVLVARIRNRFAHRLEVDSFDHPEVANLVDGLQSGRNLAVTYIDGRSHPLDQGWTRKDRFIHAAGDISGAVMVRNIPEGEVYSFSVTPEDLGLSSESTSRPGSADAI